MPAACREGETPSLGMDGGFGEVAGSRPAGYRAGPRTWVWGHGHPAPVLQSRVQSPAQHLVTRNGP